MKEKLADFRGGYATEAECFAKIRSLYEDCGYVIDTHTGVAAAAYDKYVKETGDDKVTVIASTASPYKFALIDELCKVSGVDIPQAIEEIRSAEVLHKTVCEKDEMKDAVKKFLGM